MVFFLPLFLYEYNTQEMTFTVEALSWTIYLGVVVTLGGYGLYNFALTKLEASKTAVFVNLIPVFTLILAYFILDEVLTINELFFASLILFGVFISQLPARRKRREEKDLIL